jgi:hypothetical protein
MSEAAAGLLDDRAHLLDARGQRRQRHEAAADGARHEHGERGLARAWWAVEHQRGGRAAFDEAAQRSAGTEQVALPDDLVEVRRSHAHGERRVGADPRRRTGMLLLRRFVEQLQIEPIFHVADATGQHRQPLRSPSRGRGRVPSAERAEPTLISANVRTFSPRPVPSGPRAMRVRRLPWNRRCPLP